ncbi:MAG: response regulator [Acidimicrobiia bacterium]|nr:response regulator [Acidimicrobiia bacterium]MDH3397164.1 response regulator [Acidimicrobiia bacterium]
MAEHQTSRGKVLVVEDEVVPRRLLVLSLERVGFEVVACEDGPSALEAANTQSFDAAVLDIRLPKMHGWDVLARLREDPRTSDLPVLVVTAYEGAESQRLSTVTKPDAFLAKPYDVDRLRREVIALVEKSQARRGAGGDQPS